MATEGEETEIKERPKVNPGYAQLKEEYVLVDYKPKLITEYVSDAVKEKMEADKGDADKEETGEPPSKRMKLKGRNKKRPRGKRIDPASKICPSVIRGDTCSYGNSCKFSHDKAKFMSEKNPDIGEECYVFNTFGRCPYGLACRFASKHITEDFKNVENREGKKRQEDTVCNTLSKDLQVKLWKKQYDFSRSADVVSKVFAEQGMKKDGIKNFSCQKPETQTEGTDDSENLLGSQSSEPDSSLIEGRKIGDQSEPTEEIAENGSVLVKNGDAHSDTPNCDSNHTASVEPSCDESEPQSVDSTVKSELSMDIKKEPGKPTSTSDPGAVGQLEDTAVTLEQDGPIRLRPQEKKTVNFSDKLYLAPLTTVGNLPFRRVCKRFGADVTCGEMAVSLNLLQGKASEWALLKRHESEDLFGVQLCGGYPDPMTRCAQLVNDNLSVDFVDINCGCPIDLIFNKGEGSALMGRHTKFEQIVRGMNTILDVPLTVKIRTGIYGSQNIAHNLVPKLRDWGVALTTIHGRSREQRYTKSANWDYINQCAKLAAPMPVFGNGDILSYQEANKRREETGVSGVMLARGALIKPWLFREIKEQRDWDISSGERFDMLRDFTNFGLEHWGSDHQGVENTRRFLLEWLSFLHRYIPVGLLERPPQKINERPPYYRGRDDMETLMASPSCGDWIKISEMLLGPVPEDFSFLPKHKANAYK